MRSLICLRNSSGLKRLRWRFGSLLLGSCAFGSGAWAKRPAVSARRVMSNVDFSFMWVVMFWLVCRGKSGAAAALAESGNPFSYNTIIKCPFGGARKIVKSQLSLPHIELRLSYVSAPMPLPTNVATRVLVIDDDREL